MIAQKEITLNKEIIYLIEALKVEGYWSSKTFTLTLQNKDIPLLNHIEEIVNKLDMRVGKRILLKIRLKENTKKAEIKLIQDKKELNFHIEKSPFDENKVKAVISLPYKEKQKIVINYKNKEEIINVEYQKEKIICKGKLECWAYGDLRFPNKKLLEFLDKYANKKHLEIGKYLQRNNELIASAFSALVDCEGSLDLYGLHRRLRVRMRNKLYLNQWAELLKDNKIGCKFKKNNDKEYEINITGWEDFKKLELMGIKFYNSKKEKRWKEIMGSFKRNQISRDSYKEFYVKKLKELNKKVTSQELAENIKKSKRVVSHYLLKLEKVKLIMCDRSVWPYLYFISTSSVR